MLLDSDDLRVFPWVSVLECHGFGRKGSHKSHKRIMEFLVEPNRHVKLEIECAKNQVDRKIPAIKGQMAGSEEDSGKFYLCYLEERVGAVGVRSVAGTP